MVVAPVATEQPQVPQLARRVGTIGRDLRRALWCQLSGVAYERQVLADYPETVALFPNEWLRDPHSRYLTHGHHDVPWDDPALLKAYVNGFVR